MDADGALARIVASCFGGSDGDGLADVDAGRAEVDGDGSGFVLDPEAMAGLVGVGDDPDEADFGVEGEILQLQDGIAMKEDGRLPDHRADDRRDRGKPQHCGEPDPRSAAPAHPVIMIGSKAFAPYNFRETHVAEGSRTGLRSEGFERAGARAGVGGRSGV